MSVSHLEKSWNNYCQGEIAKLVSMLRALGFSLAAEQPHIAGERYLFAGKKLVLLGNDTKNNQAVVIKVSNQPCGIAEINHERDCRQILEKIKFAQQVFFFPTEILFVEKDGYTILITAFIEQDNTFLTRSQIEQFFLALKALEVQEGVQATTYEHAQVIRKTFGLWRSGDYLRKFFEYQKNIITALPENIEMLELLSRADKFLQANIFTLDLYADFLTHWDFVPHNFRVKKHDIYLLDHSSFRFGSKHESWARFINFMVLYNPELASNLINYLKDNRDASELLSLRLMRVFRLAEIIQYYVKTLHLAETNLKTLNKKRILFWAEVLKSVLADQVLDQKIVDNYKLERDALRSEAEKIRQKNLH